MPLEEDPEATRTEPLPVVSRPAAPAAGKPSAHIVTKRVTHDDEDDDGTAPIPPKRSSRWVLAGAAAAVAVAAVSLWAVLRPDTPKAAVSAAEAPKATARPQAAQSAALPGMSAAREPGVLAAPGQQSVAAHPGDSRVAKTSTVASRGASAARHSSASAGQTVAQAPARPASAQRDPVQEQGVNGLVPPSVTCKDKMFLTRQFCIYTECQKPGYQNFPSCVRQREDAKLREGSRYGN